MTGKITVKNHTTLTDYSALIRAGMYMAGCRKEAEEDGFCFEITENDRHIIVKITEEKK